MKALLMVLALLSSATLCAHPGHADPISKDVAVRRASAEMNRLVDAGKLDASWKLAATLQTATLSEKQGAREWAVTFTNPKAAKELERTLHVFLTDQGEYLAANFTGR